MTTNQRKSMPQIKVSQAAHDWMRGLQAENKRIGKAIPSMAQIVDNLIQSIKGLRRGRGVAGDP